MSSLSTTLHTPTTALRELAIATAVYAAAESAALLALVENSPAADSANSGAALATLAAIRPHLLQTDTLEAAELWETLVSTAKGLRGPLIDHFCATQDALQAEIISNIGAIVEDMPVLVKAQAILQRQELVVVVAGDFKRGKSTLINALLGLRLLPTRVAPATAVPCELRYAPALRARILYRNGRTPEEIPIQDLERYACIALPTEQDVQAFRSDIVRLQIGVPWALPTDVTLIDLPGLNEEAGRAEMAQTEVAQADVVLMVLAATQPMADDELQFLEALWDGGHRSFLFSINHRDQLEEHERALVAERASVLLAPFRGSLDESIFLVSAREALMARLHGKSAPSTSGVPSMEAALDTLLISKRHTIQRSSQLRQILDLVETIEWNAGQQVLDGQAKVRQLQADLFAIERRLATAERIYAEGDIAAAFDIAQRRRRITDYDQFHEARWVALETELRERCRREPLPWIWQKAEQWLRDELISAIREVHPQVTPRPEGHLHLRKPPGLRLGRDALIAFYRDEALREWNRFTGAARHTRRRELEEALAEAERVHRRLLEGRTPTWAPLEARRATLNATLTITQQATEQALRQAQEGATMLQAILQATSIQ